MFVQQRLPHAKNDNSGFWEQRQQRRQHQRRQHQRQLRDQQGGEDGSDETKDQDNADQELKERIFNFHFLVNYILFTEGRKFSWPSQAEGLLPQAYVFF